MSAKDKLGSEERAEGGRNSFTYVVRSGFPENVTYHLSSKGCPVLPGKWRGSGWWGRCERTAYVKTLSREGALAVRVGSMKSSSSQSGSKGRV